MKRRFAMHSATTGASTLLDAIDVARAGDFDAIEIGSDKLAEHLAAGGTLGEVRQSLGRTGIEALALSTTEPIALPRGTDDVAALARAHESLCESAADIGCSFLVVRPPRPMDQAMPRIWHDTVARTLASVSRTAADHGIRVALEFVGTGSSTVRTFAQAREIASAAAPPVGLVLDAFHFHAGASTYAMLDGLDAASVCIVRLNDSENLPLENLSDANRTLPGDGVIAMRELLRQVESVGYRGAYSIQLPRPEYYDWEPRRLARVAHESIEAVCAEKDEQEGLFDYD